VAVQPARLQAAVNEYCLHLLHRGSTGKLFKKVILHLLQKHIEERGLLNTNQFGFHAHHSMTLQHMKL
jgi:hypothetical protein